MSEVPATATVDGRQIAYEIRGEPGQPDVLLVMGLGMQMIAWPQEFCDLLVAKGFRTTRFDNRDVGLSTHLHEAGVPDLSPLFEGRSFTEAPYFLADMAEDTVGLMDALGIERAHVVGASLGGMIVQEMAIRHPHRLASLTSIMSTPAPSVGAATPEAAVALLTPPATDEDEAADRAVRIMRVIGSPGHPFDEAEVRTRARESFRRSHDPAGIARQLAAIQASGDRRERLAAVAVPALVLHGEADPLVQIEGGRATAAAIPGARMVTYPGMGHDLPRDLWGSMVGEIVEHARAQS